MREFAFNTGWGDTALKIANFIKDQKGLFITNSPRMVDPKIMHADSVRTSKCQSKEAGESLISDNSEAMSVLGGDTEKEKGLLDKCIMGSFNVDLTEKPTLANIRKWAVNTWKKSFEISIYEIGGCSFLFEFPNKNMLEHVIHGEWT